MVIGLLKEQQPETRVSLLPEHVASVLKWNATLLVESGAGLTAFASDDAYAKAGANICSRNDVLQQADLILTMHPPADSDLQAMGGKTLLGFFQVLFQTAFVRACCEKQITLFSMDMLPRTTRAQSMDVLSSQANIAGYKAVLLAAQEYPRYFPMFMTAAGSVAPVKLLILGAGVAGLQAIATARRLGAVVEVFDTRPAVKEEVMSLGARFVEVEGAADASKAGGYAVEQSADFMQRQQERIAEAVAKADVVITTAQIPGKKAPILITRNMIETMRNGSVIVDLAAATGGNTDCTENNATVTVAGVKIIGNSALPSTMPSDASKLYGKNILNFIQLMISKEGLWQPEVADDLVQGTMICRAGQIIHERLKS